MALVKHFVLPDGNTYDVADATARSNISSLATRVTDAESAISNLTKPRAVLCIGDSYLLGSGNSNPTVENWGNNLREYLGLTQGTNYWAFGGSGYGFMREPSDNFYALMQNAVSLLSTAQLQSITDIVIGGGANDHMAGQTYVDKLVASFANIKTLVDSYFSADVKVHVVAMGWNMQYTLRAPLLNTYDLYARQCAVNNFIYHECYTILQNKNYLNNDGVHPTPTGQDTIGVTLANFLKGSSFIDYTGNKDWYMEINSQGCGRGYVVGKEVILKFLGVTLTNPNPIAMSSWNNFGEIYCQCLLGGLSNTNLIFSVPAIANPDTDNIDGIAEFHLYKDTEDNTKNTINAWVRFLTTNNGSTVTNTLNKLQLKYAMVPVPMPLA